jgi:hypothetical protein
MITSIYAMQLAYLSLMLLDLYLDTENEGEDSEMTVPNELREQIEGEDYIPVPSATVAHEQLLSQFEQEEDQVYQQSKNSTKCKY